jgi:hypothetical protein
LTASGAQERLRAKLACERSLITPCDPKTSDVTQLTKELLEPEMHFDDSATFKHAPGCELSHISEGFIVYRAETEKVHLLNPTAAIVYDLCGTGQSLPVIADFLQEKFSLAEPPLAEVGACIDNFLAEGLIEPQTAVP